MTSQRNVSYRPTSNMIFEGTEWIWKYWMGWTWLSWNTSVWFRIFWETLAKTCRRRAVKCLKPLNSTRARKTYAASALEKDRAVAGTGSLGSLVEIHSFYRLPVLKCYSLAVQKKRGTQILQASEDTFKRGFLTTLFKAAVAHRSLHPDGKKVGELASSILHRPMEVKTCHFDKM